MTWQPYVNTNFPVPKNSTIPREPNAPTSSQQNEMLNLLGLLSNAGHPNPLEMSINIVIDERWMMHPIQNV